ncbi:MAG: energy transducer TonB [Caulobacterales bacterium]
MAEPRSLRAASLGASAALLGLTVFAAFSARITAIEDIFKDAPIVDIQTPEIKEDIPPPRPKPIQPPPETQVLPSNPDFQPTPYQGEFTTAPEALGPREIIGARWVRQPSGAEFERYYPERAAERGRSGQVILDCLVGAGGEIACAVLSETPPGWGFGAAALRISRYFEMAPQMADGQPTAGGHVRVPISFRIS